MKGDVTQELQAAWCPHHGWPLTEAYTANGFNWCPLCRKLYRVIIEKRKVSVIEDNMLTYDQSATMRWMIGMDTLTNASVDAD